MTPTTITPDAVQTTVYEALDQFGAEPADLTPRRDVRGARRRLARPRRAHRRSSRRSTASSSRARTSPKIKTVGDAVDLVAERVGMSREVVITGVGAVTPLGVGARTLHERWCAGRRDRGRRGRAQRVRAHGRTSRQGGAPRRPLHAARARRGRRGAGRGRLGRGELPYDPDRIGCIIGTGIGGIGTLERQQRRPARPGAEEGPAARRPADDEQRRARRAVDAPRPARPGLRHRLGLRGGRARDRRRRAA